MSNRNLKQTTVSFSEEEHAIIKTAASMKGMTMSAYVREQLVPIAKAHRREEVRKVGLEDEQLRSVGKDSSPATPAPPRTVDEAEELRRREKQRQWSPI